MGTSFIQSSNASSIARSSRGCMLGAAMCFGLSFTLLGCNNKTNTLTPLVPMKVLDTASQAVTVNFCTEPAVQQKFEVKTLVILDHSGSNQKNYLMDPSGSGAPDTSSGTIVISPQYATDPTGILRYGTPTASGTLLNYLANLPQNDPTDPQKFFALIDFNSNVQTYPANSQGFTSDLPSFYKYVLKDATANNGSPSDVSSTDYSAALQAAFNIINNDVQNAIDCSKMALTAAPTANCPQPGVSIVSSYAIVFASDGAPILQITNASVNPDGTVTLNGPIGIQEEDTNTILGEVQAIMGLTANTKFVAGINLFTVYYYNQANNIDRTAQNLLAQMAKTGNGLSYSAVSGTQLNYAQFLPPKKLIKYSLADVFVTNASAVWWTDGQLHLDTDMDGLPDDIELAWGTDPNQTNTNGNGISDLVRYRLSNGARCNTKNNKGVCIDPPINYAANQCSGVKSSNVGGNTVFAASDPDGFNDCEKILLNDVGGVGNPDSNDDIIPDWLEFINGISFQLNAPSAETISANDGMSAYQKIKYSLPITYPLNQILNAQPSNYNLTQTSTSATQDCYNLVVTGLPVIGASNTVRVDVIEKSPLLQDGYIYHVGKKSFSTGSSVQLNDWTDPGEIANKTWGSWQ